jgi:hypothetical protein
MAVHQIQRYVRPYEEAKENMLERARRGTFEFTEYDVVKGVFDQLTTLDKDAWAAAFMAVARPYEERAQAAEARGDTAAAQQDYLRAYAYYRLGRYPTTNSPGKRESYLKSVDCYLKAARWFDPPLERVEIPFAGRPGEGDRIIGYYRHPKAPGRTPILVAWGGIDGYKEDRRAEPYLARGIAVLALDNAGVGQAPIKGADDAERMWDTIFDWVAARAGVDAARMAIMGNSTGGYWAAKLAHIRRDRIRCAVNHGGCSHFTFTPEWIEKAQHGEYAYELAETLSYAFLRGTFEDWVEQSPKLSLVDQGVLDQPCSPLLLVNGTKDSIFPIEDMYLLFEHGDPKVGFFPPVGHMGNTPRTPGVILDWVSAQLGV